jgi:hypothetical protein
MPQACEAARPADNAAMTRAGDDEKTKPSGSRAERLAVALRENLRRRKAQERERRAREAPEARGPAPRDDKNR